MRSILITVGSEFLNLDRSDTNSTYIAKRLREKGIMLDMKMTVGDSLENLSWLVKKSSQRVQLVVITGGLGPTEDDITREAVSSALKKKLIFREEIASDIEEMFRKRGLAMPEINTRQAFVLEGAEILPNPFGTAPGQYIEKESCKVLLLPGPPAEMIPMFEAILEKKIAPLSNYFIYSRIFKLAGITESETDALIAEIYNRYRNPLTTILASPGGIEIHLLGRSKDTVDEAKLLTDELASKIREPIKDYIFSEMDIGLENLIVSELTKKQLTLAVAESCTGGGLGNTITNVSGSSAVFKGGVIAYSNEVKIKVLGVSQELLASSGAVSADVARQMAEGVRNLTSSDIGLAITGIAGPGGGSDKKPVGLVHFHLSSSTWNEGFHKLIPGPREIIKLRSIHYSLDLIRKFMNSKA